MLFLLVFVDSLKNISGFLMFVIIGKIDNNVVSLRQCRHASGIQNLVDGTLDFDNFNWGRILNSNNATLISLINVESMITDFEKFHPPQKQNPRLLIS